MMHELRSTLGKMELALGAIDDAIVWTDQDGRVQWANAVFSRLLWRPYIEFVGKPLDELLTLEQDGKVLESARHPVKRLSHGAKKIMETYRFYSEGKDLMLEISGLGVSIGPDRTLILVLRDVTERVNGELAMEKANRELRESQEKMIRSEKLASIGELASGVGHELRNPLAAIRNALYYVRDALKESALSKEDPGLMEFLDMADREIQSATHIIGDLLDFARTPELVLQLTDVNALLLEAKGIIEIPASVYVIEHFGADLPPVAIDRERMRQVFMNLLQNAVQAIPKDGEVHITTRTVCVPEGSKSKYLLVDIRDTGTGISDQDRKKIFEPLFTTKAKGTGLGLPICLGIVQTHSGEITVESRAGAGATFTVRLPVGGN
jgi:signal transduction histidine kinase